MGGGGGIRALLQGQWRSGRCCGADACDGAGVGVSCGGGGQGRTCVLVVPLQALRCRVRRGLGWVSVRVVLSVWPT